MRENRSKALVEAASRLFPSGVEVSSRRTGDVSGVAVPESLLRVGASRKRQREFIAGRLAAQEALASFLHNPEFPASSDSRAPLWPDGTTGSISHTDDVALAVAASKDSFASLGLDIEVVRELEAEIERQVLTDTELEEFAQRPSESRTSFLLLRFSCKESIYKCVHPLFNQYIDFRDVEIIPGAVAWTARCIDPAHPAASLVATVQGNSRIVDNHVISACWLPATFASLRTS